MEDFGSDYQPEDYTQSQDNLTEGDYRVRIDNVETTTAKSSGNPMIVLTLAIAQVSFTFRYNLVKNEHFNANATKFFDCFKIPRGNFEYQRWVNRVGMAHIAKGKVRDNGKSYWEIQYLIVDTAQGAPRQAPPAPGPARAQANAPATRQPARQRVPGDDFVDDDPVF